MADYYTESSTVVEIPEEKKEQAAAILTRIRQELEESEMDDGLVEFSAEFQRDGLWIHNDEGINIEQVEQLIRALVEELDLPGVHICSWSHSCSRPITDAFSGGAFAIQKGFDTVWSDPEVDVLLKLEGLKEAAEKEKDGQNS